jgi:hypothetical protein
MELIVDDAEYRRAVGSVAKGAGSGAAAVDGAGDGAGGEAKNDAAAALQPLPSRTFLLVDILTPGMNDCQLQAPTDEEFVGWVEEIRRVQTLQAADAEKQRVAFEASKQTLE